MSQENVEIVRRIYEAFAAHRFPAEYLAADFAWETQPEQPGADTHRGHAAVRAYFREWVGGWHDAKSEVERVFRPRRPSDCARARPLPPERDGDARRAGLRPHLDDARRQGHPR